MNHGRLILVDPDAAFEQLFVARSARIVHGLDIGLRASGEYTHVDAGTGATDEECAKVVVGEEVGIRHVQSLSRADQ